jgi:DNA-binding MurR/RpiR family transcriptional regulator
MNHYSPAEGRVADYVLENPTTTLNLTTKQLAKQCQCSEATIIRFCQRVGINSFKELKIELAKGAHKVNAEQLPNLSVNFEDETDAVLEKVMSKSMSALMNTNRLVSSSAIDAAAEAIHGAKRVFLYGAGGSSVVALDAQYKLLRIDISALFSLDSHVQMVMATNMTKDDVLFVVSTSGQTKEVVELMQIAKDKGAAVILLTQHGSSPASRLADILLTISVEEQHIRIGTMSARIAQLAIVDAMFIRLCIQKGNQVFERIIDTHNVIQKIKR